MFHTLLEVVEIFFECSFSHVVNFLRTIESIKKINKNTISDHFGIELLQTVNFKPTINNNVTKRKYLNVNRATKLINLLKLETWEKVFLSQNTEEKYQNFHDIFLSYVDKVIPVTNTKFKDKNPLVKDAYSLHLTEQVKLFESLHIQDPENQLFKDNLNRSKILLKEYVNQCERNENKKNIDSSSNKSKSSWEVVYSNIHKSKQTHKTIAFVKDIDQNVYLPASIAELFNHNFVNKPINQRNNFSKNSNDDNIFIPVTSNPNSLFCKPTTVQEVLYTISRLKNSKAYDIFEISTHITKTVAEFIAPPICDIFNKSIEEGVFPSHLKIAKVVPVFKANDPTDINNYRPISILPIVSNFFEKIMLEKMNEFLIAQCLLNDCQHGFRKGFSTTTAAFKFVAKIHEYFDNREKALGVFIDLSKAFDLVDHLILLSKLELFGFRGVILNWFRSYLHNRKQHVFVNTQEGSAQSSCTNVNLGVPQGSILGPLLYILYVNDFVPNFDEYHVTCYAHDDTNFIVNGNDLNVLSTNASNVLEKCNSWFSEQQLHMNENKTALILFQNCHALESISLNLNETDTITSENYTKFLGLYVDAQLNWKIHIDKLCNKLSRSLFALRVLKDKLDFSTLRLVYHALFQSHLSYGIMLWGNSSQQNTARVQRQQKKAIRIMARLGHNESCKPYFKQLGLMTVIGLYIYEILTFVRSNLNIIQQDPVNHKYDTRNRENYIRPIKQSTAIYEKSVSYSGISLYNILPHDMHQASEKMFKKRLKLFLLENTFYELSEFQNCNKSAM